MIEHRIPYALDAIPMQLLDQVVQLLLTPPLGVRAALLIELSQIPQIVAVVAVAVARRLVGLAARGEPEHGQAQAGEGGREACQARIVGAVGVCFAVCWFLRLRVPFEGLEDRLVLGCLAVAAVAWVGHDGVASYVQKE